ncbi:MAG: 50S ribosomal protein L24 [Clostridia bacterium]|nr:50S ribosomal protein L24 [Clostridia bacterium]
MKKLHIKKDDVVVVNSGDDKGSKAKVLAVSPEEGKVIVEGLNMVKKHVKPRKQGETGGIVEAEGAFYASKVNLYCPNCDKGVRVKVKTQKDGTKVRTCAKCGKEL